MEHIAKEWSLPELQGHLEYVLNPVPAEEQGRRYASWGGGFVVRDKGHEGMTVEDFMALPEAQSAGLRRPEVVAIRLYSGPGFGAMNSHCRRSRFNTQFPVTGFCLDWAIGKLAPFTKPGLLVRGLKGNVRPGWRNHYANYEGQDVCVCVCLCVCAHTCTSPAVPGRCLHQETEVSAHGCWTTADH